MAKIEISLSTCTHLASISHYNHNYYYIPVIVDGCNVVLEICDEEYDSYEYYLGKLEEGAFSKNDPDRTFYSCEFGFEKCYRNIILDDKYKNVWLG